MCCGESYTLDDLKANTYWVIDDGHEKLSSIDAFVQFLTPLRVALEEQSFREQTAGLSWQNLKVETKWHSVRASDTTEKLRNNLKTHSLKQFLLSNLLLLRIFDETF